VLSIVGPLLSLKRLLASATCWQP